MLVIDDATVGKITLKKNARAKRIILKVKPNQGVWVTLPTSASYAAGKKMVAEHTDWILQQLKKQQAQTAFFQLGTVLQIRDKQLKIIATEKEESSLLCDTLSSSFQFFVPLEWNINSNEIQNFIRKNIIEILRAEAKSYLVPRTRALAAQKNIFINKVTIKNMRTRWGSCSSKSNINLSLFLMLLSDELIDYVIWHELAHIKHKNHSAAFWQHLEHLLPNSKVFDRQMRAIQIPF